jgi:hypothetical protein
MIRRLLTWLPRHRLAQRILVGLCADPSTRASTKGDLIRAARVIADLFYGVAK